VTLLLGILEDPCPGASVSAHDHGRDLPTLPVHADSIMTQAYPRRMRAAPTPAVERSSPPSRSWCAQCGPTRGVHDPPGQEIEVTVVPEAGAGPRKTSKSIARSSCTWRGAVPWHWRNPAYGFDNTMGYDGRHNCTW